MVGKTGPRQLSCFLIDEWCAWKIALKAFYKQMQFKAILLDFSLSVKAATLIFIYGRGSAISSAKEGKSGFIHDLVER